jgi:CubicO group peptidase (beta-lactamase class C family)
MELMDTLCDKNKIHTNKDIIEIFSKLKPKVLFEPNQKFEYSNTGYALLASIVEIASKQTFADFLTKFIFKPLDMTNSFVYTRRMSPRQIDNYAFGYIYSDSLKSNILPDSLAETKIVYWLDGIVGDGTVNSTTSDLLKWDRALYTNKLCSQASIKEVFKPVNLLDKTKSYYGFGWFIDLNKDYGTIVKHSGGWPGYVTFIDRHIVNDKTIIILQNTDRGNLPMQTLRAILYNKTIPTTKTRIEIKLPEDILKQYIGVYEFDKDNTITYFILDGELKAQVTHQPAFTVFAETETKFFHKVVDAQQEFIKDKDNRVYKLIFSQGGQTIEAKKIK